MFGVSSVSSRVKSAFFCPHRNPVAYSIFSRNRGGGGYPLPRKDLLRLAVQG